MVAQPSARERLLDAAEDLAFTHGVAATPVDVILRRANVAPATLYAHFGNKEGLIVSALQRRLTQWGEAWQQEIDAAATDRERLLAVFPALLSFRAGATPARWCAFLGVTAESPAPGEALDQTLASDTQLLSDRFRELAVPLVGREQAEAVSAHLVLIFTGTLGMMLRGMTPEAAAAQGLRTAGMVVDGFVLSLPVSE